uniref:Uncharacterized protein n=1 Tax=Anopheles christyi TaxID=43041 RepID=A0A182KAH8_9DIPT
CTGRCLTAPSPIDPLVYLPTLEYLRNVLRLSTLSLSEVKLETNLPLAYKVSQPLNSVRDSLNEAQKATEKIVELFEAKDTFPMHQLAEALHKIQHSLCETDFHFPVYIRNENVSQEMDQLKRTMSEHLRRIEFQTDTLKFGELREIDSFLVGATSQAMFATAAVHVIASVEKVEYYLKAFYFPPHMEETALKELQDIGQLVRAYDELYTVALRSSAKRFLEEASEGRQLLYTLLGTAPALPERVKTATEEFLNRVDNFIHTVLGELQTIKGKGNDRFGEVVQNTLYTAFGLLSSGLEMLRPNVRNYQCVLNMVPQTHTVAGISLGSVALCSNVATTPLYDSTMVYRQKADLLRREVFEQLQKAVACNGGEGNCSSVYSETVELITSHTDTVKAFTVDLQPYREQLLSCLTTKYEVEMGKRLLCQ